MLWSENCTIRYTTTISTNLLPKFELNEQKVLTNAKLLVTIYVEPKVNYRLIFKPSQVREKDYNDTKILKTSLMRQLHKLIMLVS